MKQTRMRAAPLETTESFGGQPLHFRQMEWREWGLWTAAVIVTLLLTAGLASFMLPALHENEDDYSRFLTPDVVRGLLALVLIFDIYTLYQQLLIHRIRRRLLQREELFRLISENAADLIAVVDMQGNRIYNSLSYQKVLGYSPEELKSSSSFEQIHPEDRDRVKRRLRKLYGPEWACLWNIASGIRTEHGLCLNQQPA